jgi:hypothetical protein
MTLHYPDPVFILSNQKCLIAEPLPNSRCISHQLKTSFWSSEAVR